MVTTFLMSRGVIAADIAWFEPSLASNSNATIFTTDTYTSNFGVAFLTGGSGPFTMDWVNLGLNTSSQTSGAGSFKLALHSATNSTAYSAVAGTTEYAMDVVNFTAPTSTNTNFTLNLTSADIPNITNFAMAANSAYTLVIYRGNVAWGLQRTTGIANGTTNNFYNVSDGFQALDTFRNNTANYTNNTNSYPTLAISFGQTVVPEPSTWALGAIGTIVCVALRKRRKVA